GDLQGMGRLRLPVVRRDPWGDSSSSRLIRFALLGAMVAFVTEPAASPHGRSLTFWISIVFASCAWLLTLAVLARSRLMPMLWLAVAAAGGVVVATQQGASGVWLMFVPCLAAAETRSLMPA